MRDKDIRDMQERGKSAEYERDELRKENKGLSLAILKKNDHLVELGKEEILNIIADSAVISECSGNILISPLSLHRTSKGSRVSSELTRRIDAR
jgi:hypothetical protein